MVSFVVAVAVAAVVPFPLVHVHDVARPLLLGGSAKAASLNPATNSSMWWRSTPGNFTVNATSLSAVGTLIANNFPGGSSGGETGDDAWEIVVSPINPAMSNVLQAVMAIAARGLRAPRRIVIRLLPGVYTEHPSVFFGRLLRVTTCRLLRVVGDERDPTHVVIRTGVTDTALFVVSEMWASGIEFGGFVVESTVPLGEDFSTAFQIDRAQATFFAPIHIVGFNVGIRLFLDAALTTAPAALNLTNCAIGVYAEFGATAVLPGCLVQNAGAVAFAVVQSAALDATGCTLVSNAANVLCAFWNSVWLTGVTIVPHPWAAITDPPEFSEQCELH